MLIFVRVFARPKDLELSVLSYEPRTQNAERKTQNAKPYLIISLFRLYTSSEMAYPIRLLTREKRP